MAASCESPFSQFSFAPSPEQVVQCVWKKKNPLFLSSGDKSGLLEAFWLSRFFL
uniref:Uncharacterized protein n=1 Tax=Anguilla anguilla TaxID=7936 RepID=A0A0E9VLZ5_ANGAN